MYFEQCHDAMSSTADLRNSIHASENGLTLAELLTAHPGVARRTAQRLIAKLIDSGQITAAGQGRARRYFRADAQPDDGTLAVRQDLAEPDPRRLAWRDFIKQPLRFRRRQTPTLSQIPQDVPQEPVAFEIRLLLHRISAGFPSPAADYAEEGLDLNDYLVRNKPATFMFTVKGDSMIGASIEEGDKVVVDRALNPKHDDIVVAVVDGEYTIKRLYRHQGRVELRPENPAYSPIMFTEGIELVVWGVVVGVVRRYPFRS